MAISDIAGYFTSGLRTMGSSVIGGLVQSAFSPTVGAINAALQYGVNIANRAGSNYTNFANITGNVTAGNQSASNLGGGSISGTVKSYFYERNASTQSLGPRQAAPLETSGYVPDITGGVPKEYLVSVQNTKGAQRGALKSYLVRAVMQGQVSFRTHSEWMPMVNADGNTVNAFTQLILKRAAVTRWSSRRIWMGTQPLQIMLTLKFLAVGSALTEVVLPCLRLQQMSAPSVSQTSTAGALVDPPGPTPYNFATGSEQISSWTKADSRSPFGMWDDLYGPGDKIRIKIGTMLVFPSVIIEDVQVTFNPKLTREGKPISAEAVVMFSTYEMYTKEDLEMSYGV